jgi:uncharacterized protein (UPF0332 family)
VSAAEIQLYLDRAHQDLLATQSILDQSYYGVAVSRAYYAMFYAATALLASKGISRSTHSGVVSAFSEHFVKTGLIEAEFAKVLGQALESRLDSDYDITFSAEQVLATKVFQDAQRFVGRIESYLQQKGFAKR